MDARNALVDSIVIAGGGTAGWMVAASLAKALRGRVAIRLVESEEIGSVGVGEATIPMIQLYNRSLEIDEDAFVRATQASFKLGIEFVDWGRVGGRYIHGFGRFGQDLGTVPFDQYWQKMHQAGRAADLGDYGIARSAARAGKFMRPTSEFPDSPLADIAYAFHFDAALYAGFLRRLAESWGVQRLEGRIARVQTAGPDRIAALHLADGRCVEGALFIDCTGFRGLLIEEALHAGFEDWSHWLPCDRAVAVPCAPAPVLLPYTRSTARGAGWQWRIPLQHRTGNGHVFSSAHLGEDEATAQLLAGLDGEPLAAPRTLKFKAGMRRQAWRGNCVAIGLAAGFLEPLESTSIHLIQSAVARLLAFFPGPGFAVRDIDEFNRLSRFEWERIRDFIILHYHLGERDDTPFWRHCRTMDVPDTLHEKLSLYRSHGRIVREGNELFSEVAWLQVMHGQGARAGGYHPLVDVRDEAEIVRYLDEVRTVIGACVDYMPTHQAFIDAHCKAPPVKASS